MPRSARHTALLGVLGALAASLTGGPPRSAAAEPPNEIVFRVSIDARRGGSVLCALYRHEDTWLGSRPHRSTQDVGDTPAAVCRFANLATGTYAIAALHDEDGDGAMDTGPFGIPEEGYACSRDAQLKTFFAPRWKDAVFRHRGSVTLQAAKMKY